VLRQSRSRELNIFFKWTLFIDQGSCMTFAYLYYKKEWISLELEKNSFSSMLNKSGEISNPAAVLVTME